MQAVNPTANSEDSEMCFLLTFDLHKDDKNNPQRGEFENKLESNLLWEGVELTLSTTWILFPKYDWVTLCQAYRKIESIAEALEVDNDLEFLLSAINLCTTEMTDKVHKDFRVKYSKILAGDKRGA